ncbi:MAG TPA: hypothetical protein VNJ53_07155 [Gaiellaceae bacterium]|nr:hypothetical protein [Gaiellaceae bacterium]
MAPRSLPGVLAAALLVLAPLAGCGGDAEPPRPDLVLVSTRDGDYALYAMDADGSRQTRVSEDERGDATSARRLFFQIDPAWSPDGRRIAFASRRAGTFDLYVMNVDGTGTRRLTSGPAEDRHPSWSPDGSRLVFERDESDLVVVRADGTGLRRLTGPSASESQPAWSPDGSRIAYVRREIGRQEEELWLMAANGSDARRLTFLGATSQHPAWSPDGARLAFSSNAGGPFFDVYVLTVGRKGVRRLTSVGADAIEPSWSPDGRLIAFSRDGAIVTVDEAREEETLTDSDNNDFSPAWNPVPREAETG